MIRFYSGNRSLTVAAPFEVMKRIEQCRDRQEAVANERNFITRSKN
jgi:hypothetical protein